MRPNVYGITDDEYEARWRRAHEAITDVHEIARGTTGNGRYSPGIAEMEIDLAKIAKVVKPFALPPASPAPAEAVVAAALHWRAVRRGMADRFWLPWKRRESDDRLMAAIEHMIDGVPSPPADDETAGGG